jgi:glycosyltransferase involved in cell wall biosynthesis
LARAGLTDQVRWQPNLSRDEKAAMLASLSLFSVPAIYPEACGLYLLEAMAAGVPVVQPAASSFPEVIATSGVGELVPPGDPVALAQAWHRLLLEPETLRGMAEKSRLAAERYHDVTVMRDRFLWLARQVVASPTPLTTPPF